MATDNFWAKFRRWRRSRPFWGSLFLLLSGAELFYTANMSLSGFSIKIGPEGFLSYLLPLILVICALLCTFSPAQRLFYGIIGLLAALYSFVGLNLGGFFLGMLLGIIGGALVIAWGPPRSKPGEVTELPPDGEPIDHTEDEPEDIGTDVFGAEEDYHPHPADAPTEQIQLAGHDDRPAVRDALPDEAPTSPDIQEGPKSRLTSLAKNPRALTVGFVVAGMTATLLVAGSRAPASADDCPEGLPSRSTSATTSETTAAAEKAAAAAAKTAKTAKKKATTSSSKTSAASTSKAGTASAGASPSASASASASKKSNPIVDGLTGIVDGIGNLLGLGDDSSASPSASPSPSESATTEPTTEPATTEPTKTASPTDAPSSASSASSASSPTTKASASASVLPTASGDDIPCLGARVFGKAVDGSELPDVAAKAGLMETDSLTMYNSTYDGVAKLTTKDGTEIDSLQFSMDKAVNKPFTLTVTEPQGGQTVITTPDLTVSGHVKFYTSSFSGNLFGLIPVTFTPSQPPPLTLPVLWFTNVKIQRNLVQSDTLTGDPLEVKRNG